MPQVCCIDGLVPVVHPSAFVHESAVLVGDVIPLKRLKRKPSFKNK